MKRIGILAAIAGALMAGARADDNTLLVFDGVATNISVPVVIGATGTNNGWIITNRAVVSSASVVVGEGARAEQNYVAVSGSGTTWQVAGLMVGRGGSRNGVVVSDGARLLSGTCYLGYSEAGVDNRVVVTGSGSFWGLSDRLVLGAMRSRAQFVVTNGGRLEALYECWIGSKGLVAGVGSVLNAETVNVLGDGRSGAQLVIADGGRVNCGYGFIGRSSAARGHSVAVSGPGSVWLVTNRLETSMFDCGLSITEGGRVECYRGDLGGVPLQVNVQGPGSLLAAQSELHISGGSYYGYPTLTNRLTVGSGGTVAVTNSAGNALLHLSGKSIVNLDGGHLVADRLWVTNAVDGPTPTLELKHGRFSFGEAALCYDGPAVLGDETGLGPLEMRGGNLVCLPRRTNLTLLANVVLTAGGSVYGHLTNRGAIRVGNPLGTLRVAVGFAGRMYGDFVNQGSVALDIAGTPASGQQDLLAIGGRASLGGQLQVELLGNYRPAWTNVFSLIRWGSYDGAFTNAPPGSRLAVVGGSFRVTYTPQELLLTDYMADSDGDGLDDLWATTYFGHSPLSLRERMADTDGDGLSNEAEYVAGTNPLDASSLFRVLSAAPERGQVRVRFGHVLGKRYRLWHSPGVGDWKEVPAPTLVYPQAGMAEWVDDGSFTGGPPLQAEARFYRISVE